MCQFLVECWRKLGLDVRIDATDYNKFQEKMYKGRFQIFEWGWMLDYPDAENFLFLLYGPNSGKYNEHSPNHARFENQDYDRLFKRMETMRDGESTTWEEPGPDGTPRQVVMTRQQIISRMMEIFEQECPWIPLLYREVPILAHGWVSNVKAHPMTYPFAKYYKIDRAQRDQARKEWNRPILWPLPVALLLTVVLLLPAIRVIRRDGR
jgi:ABC-type transport system substrate-binding protein